MKKEIIPVFFAVDDNYVDYLQITLASIIDNAKNEKYSYDFYILHNGLGQESRKKLSALSHRRFRVKFFYVGGWLDQIERQFKVRDYYTITTYYRLLIPDAFFYLDKAIYLDCDIVVLDDLSNLYNFSLGDKIVGAVPDASVQIVDEFIYYTKNALKIDNKDYFNAGVLLMNLKKMRQTKLLKRVYELSETTVFIVAQDQDLLNVLCKDDVLLLPASWNVMPIGERMYDISLIHYNLIFKPWKNRQIMYQEHFWHYAQKLDIESRIKARLDEVTEADYQNEINGMNNLKKSCIDEANYPEKYKAILNISEVEFMSPLSEERKEIYEKIKVLEAEGKFDQDVENDPPFTPLQVGSVDYKQKKLKSKVNARVYDFYSFRYFNRQIKKGNIVIDGYEGTEYLKNLKSGAIVTANHFNPFDSIPIHKAVKKYHYKKRLFKIIKEGNYTFPGLYGRFMRYCNTLPLANDFDVLKEMYRGVEYWLKKGHCILIYPEQSMWWNYRKPKPTKTGAFWFAAKNNVPVLPTFITMRQTEKLNADGDYIQAYTLHILKPIYPKSDLKFKENVAYLQSEHDKAWKELYEKVYNTKLVYNGTEDEQ